MKKLRKIRKKVFHREFSDQQMRAYFTKDDTKKKWILAISIFLGFLSLYVAYAWHEQYLIFLCATGVFWLVALIAWSGMKFGIQVPTDKEYDTWVFERGREYLRNALRKINQDWRSEEEIDQIPFIHGFVLAGTQNAKNYRERDILWRRGKDGIQRYSINVYRFFIPVEHQLVVIVIDINAVNHKDRREQIHEYFFADVVAVTTVDEYDQIGEHDYLTQSFVLRISDGKPISVTIRSHPLDYEQKLDTFELPSSKDVDATIAELRMLLRSRKQGPMY